MKAKWTAAYSLVTDILSREGRMKFIIPLYRYMYVGISAVQAEVLVWT